MGGSDHTGGQEMVVPCSCDALPGQSAEGEDGADIFPGAARPDGFLLETESTDESSSDGQDSLGSDNDNLYDERPTHWSRTGTALAALAALMSAASLAISVAAYIRPPMDAVHPSPPVHSGAACASGQALLALTRTEPAQFERMQVCVSEPVRWEPISRGAACAHGGIRVALAEGGAAELCGLENMSHVATPGQADAAAHNVDAAPRGAALVTNFVADEAVRAGQIVSFSPKGGIAPYQLFRSVMWSEQCVKFDALGVSATLMATWCLPSLAAGPRRPLLKLCKVRQQDSVVCGLAISAMPRGLTGSQDAAGEAGEVGAGAPPLLPRLVLLQGGASRLVALVEHGNHLLVQVFDTHEGPLTVTPAASGRLPLNWTRGETDRGGPA